MQGNGEAVVGARGRVLRKEDTYVVLEPKQAPRTGPKPEYSFTTDENGRWSLNSLPDGSYVIEVKPGVTDSDRKGGQRFAIRKQLITVAGADLASVLIEVSKGVSISGTVIQEGNESLSSLVLAAGKVDGPFELFQSVSKKLTPTERTTTFTMTELPEGVIELSAFLDDPNSHYIKSISANGIDLLNERLKLTSGMEVKGVTIVVASDLAEFTGRIVSDSGKTPPPRARISLVRIGTRRVLGGRLTRRADEEGTFLLRPPPGDYRIDVNEDRAEGGFLPFVKSIPLITFLPGEQKNMEIRVP